MHLPLSFVPKNINQIKNIENQTEILQNREDDGNGNNILFSKFKKIIVFSAETMPERHNADVSRLKLEKKENKIKQKSIKRQISLMLI